MAMRGARGNFTSNRPPATAIPPHRIHEKFSPNSEWKTEKESDVLLVFLPDFLKQNIKVTTEAGNILRITGERPVGVNKLSRFQEDFQIPRKCNIKAIRAKFEGGILNITFPWTITSSSTTSTDQKPKPSPPLKTEQNVKPTSQTTSTSTDQKPKPSQPIPAVSPPLKTEQNVKPSSQTTPTTVTIPPVVPTLPTPESKSPEKSSFQTMSTPKSPNVSNYNLPKEQRKFEEFSRPPLVTDDKTPLLPTLGHGKGALSADVLKKKDDVKNEKAEKKKGGEMYVDDLEKKLGIEKIEDVETKDKEEKVSKNNGDDQEDYKQVMKGLARGINEEKVLLVNMGAAVLVIVALGAYICYTSSKH